MKIIFFTLFLTYFAQANILVQSISGADTVWSGYMESHITFCNQRSATDFLTITYKSNLSGEARLVNTNNRTLWQKPNVDANEWISIQVPWAQLCSQMGNRNCKSPQNHHFKFGINLDQNSLLEDFHMLYVQIIDRCKPSEK